MIQQTVDSCDLYKIGLMSGKKYDRVELLKFIDKVIFTVTHQSFLPYRVPKIYFKDGLLAAAGINRADLPENCVDRDFNIWNV